ncbi:mRNA splicing protein [Terramyces sp. JEL0728]|nr:mRNA splicing protein [Terramyces sp. JEL0728]
MSTEEIVREQRKAKTGEPEEKPLNPHIPLFIAKKPWYLDRELATSFKPEKIDKFDKWYERGKFQGPASTKYRKGACENCGAMSHKTKECLERPRKKGAKWTGMDIQPDEVVQKLELGFDAKRDRWNGYNPEEQLRQVEEWELVEEKRKAKRQEISKDSKELDDSDDEEKYAERGEAVGQRVDDKTRVTVRNLRIREDTAKYLRNLDLESAYYDPKTRTMRDNPYEGKDPTQVMYAGDNFTRYTGQYAEVTKMQSFAWEAEKRGQKTLANINPTQDELMFKQYADKPNIESQLERESLLEKYGGKEHLESVPQELLLAQTEQYVEYSATGEVIKGQINIPKSRYPEDILTGNHTNIWGSFWRGGEWGYKCCHSLLKGSYCGGQAAIDAEKNQITRSSMKRTTKSLAEQNKEQKIENRQTKKVRTDDGELDQEKVREEVEKMRKNKFVDGDHMTPEQLEAYRITRKRHDDPMANYVDKE